MSERNSCFRSLHEVASNKWLSQIINKKQGIFLFLFWVACDLQCMKLTLKKLIFIGNSLAGVPLLWKQVSTRGGLRRLNKATPQSVLSFTHLNGYGDHMFKVGSVLLFVVFPQIYFPWRHGGFWMKQHSLDTVFCVQFCFQPCMYVCVHKQYIYVHVIA